MKIVLWLGALVAILMVWAIYDAEVTARTRTQAAIERARAFNCRAPLAAGEFTVITVTLRDGALIGDCDYLIARPKKKGG